MLEVVVRQWRDAVEAQRRELERSCEGAECIETRAGLEWRPGAVVMDLRTGQEVRVVTGTRRHIVGQAS
jgi:hypothetical protein